MAPGGRAAPGTAPVRETHRFDVDRLATYLADRLPGFAGPLEVRQFLGGQSNPTYHLRAASGEYVLRRKPPGKLLPSAHAVDREFRVIAALRATDVPVPEALVLCEDPEVVGTVFYVMRYVPGRVLSELTLPGLASAERRALWSNYYARQLHRWVGQYRASETETIPAMERLIEWLPAHVPRDDTTTLVHGDFRIGNTIVHATEPRILAILDWELSTLGHPLGDLGYLCTAFRMPSGIDGFRGVDLAELGIPAEAEVVARYCRLTGRDGIPDWEFYVAFALFRLAAICQGIMGRVRDGTASDPDARRRGQRARPLAEAALAVVELAP
jgi:aminoglycoside phosphotransferase (APT) family kinase protein